MIIKIFAKTDIPFLLQGIRRGPLSESDCSSYVNFVTPDNKHFYGGEALYLKHCWKHFYIVCFSEKAVLTKTIAEVQQELNSLRTKLEENKHTKQEALLEVGRTYANLKRMFVTLFQCRCNRPEFAPSQFFPGGKEWAGPFFPHPVSFPPPPPPPNNFKIIINLHKFKKPLLKQQ